MDKIQESQTLRVGTPGDYRPFAMKTDQGYEGHDIDVIEAMANELGLTVEYIPTSWPNLMNDLQADKFDIAVGGITRNPTRMAKVEMLPGYAPFVDILPSFSLTLGPTGQKKGISTALRRGIEPPLSRFGGFLLLAA